MRRCGRSRRCRIRPSEADQAWRGNSADSGWQERPFREPDGAVPGCTTQLDNTHGTGFRELLYRWHPWFGLPVFVHQTIDKADDVVFRCTLSGSDAARWLEIPAWMFDRAACVDEPVFAAAPHVGSSALSMLAGLLTEVLKARAAASNAPLSGASRASRDQNRGEALDAPESGAFD